MEQELGVKDELTTDKTHTYTIEQRQLTVKSSKFKSFASIYNSNGQILIKGPVPANSGVTFNLNGLTAGLYFLVVKNEDNIFLKAKFILQ